MNNDKGGDKNPQVKSKRPPDNDVAEESLLKRVAKAEEEAAKEKKRRLESEEKQAKAEEEAAEEKKRRLESEEKQAKADKRAAELERLYQQSEEEKAKIKSLSDGTYYATIDQVWENIEAKNYDNFNCFAALIRLDAPSFLGRDQVIIPNSIGRDKVEDYTKTRNSALNEAFVAAEEKTKSRTSMSDDKKNSIWPTDIFGNKPGSAQIAHLIPASSNNASLYFDVVMWVLGFPVNKDPAGLKESVYTMDWITLQKAIHGAKSQDENSRREALTGIKHSVSNKICLASQFKYFDQAPCVFIIPIMDLEEVKKWNGEGYDALVMCGSYEEDSADEVCQNIHMTKDGAVAEDESQIEKARQLLEAVILGMANSLLKCFERRLLDHNAGSKIQDFHKLRESFISPTGENGVRIPKARPRSATTESVEGLKVRVVTFSSHESGMGHPAPDPLLLTVKAAINWSRRNNQPLRAAGEKPEEEDERDTLAHELFLVWRENVRRTKASKNLARDLNQPYGYQGDVAVNSQA